jgi:hypothetical protein
MARDRRRIGGEDEVVRLQARVIRAGDVVAETLEVPDEHRAVVRPGAGPLVGRVDPQEGARQLAACGDDPRGVRKFGRAGICRESCWSPGGATSDRMAADRLAKAAPIFSPWSQAADENPPNGITPRRVEHLLGRELQRRRGGSSPRLIGHPEGTERSLTDALAPARIALLCPRQCESCGRHAGGNGSGFPWKSATSEFTNPTPSARMGISGAPGAGSLPDSGSRQRVHA